MMGTFVTNTTHYSTAQHNDNPVPTLHFTNIEVHHMPVTHLEEHLENIPCSICEHEVRSYPDWSSLSERYDASEQLNGLIAYLPPSDHIPRDSAICHQSPRLNERAFGHPCVIIDQSNCGHLVRCARCTSFGGKGIHKKAVDWYPTVRKSRMKQYIPLTSNSLCPGSRRRSVPFPPSFSSLGLLTWSGPRVDKRSYVYVTETFVIEKENLWCWKDKDSRQFRERWLEDEALEILRGAVPSTVESRSVDFQSAMPVVESSCPEFCEGNFPPLCPGAPLPPTQVRTR